MNPVHAEVEKNIKNVVDKNKKQVTMYIANRRDGSKIKGCSPLQLYLGLIDLKHAIAYLPYTQRWGANL